MDDWEAHYSLAALVVRSRPPVPLSILFLQLLTEPRNFPLSATRASRSLLIRVEDQAFRRFAVLGVEELDEYGSAVALRPIILLH